MYGCSGRSGAAAMDFLRFDSDFMAAISRAADYVLLNLLCVLFCIPIVTAGAAVTAKYYVAMKIERKEEPVVLKAYLKAFRDNFRQATILWLIGIFLVLFLAMDWYLFKDMQMSGVSSVFRTALFIFSIVVVMSLFCVFPIIARFRVTLKGAVRSAVLFSLLHIPQVALVILLEILPYYIGFHYLKWFILIWAFCSGLSLFYAARMYVKAFARIEGQTVNEE
ncbi:MAG: YesL family protein [Roseburia sp.]|nr:YesL family protein [Roseburia sp.]MCM1241965.1 YesL family protein [Roseburia sp.]